MDNERREELFQLWGSESEAPETQEWRDDLTPEELDIVSSWDSGYDNTAFLLQDLIWQRFGRQEVQEVVDAAGCYRVHLRDGRMYLARLCIDNSLRLDEISEVC